MLKPTKTDSTALAIEELEWSLRGMDSQIENCWSDVQRAQKYAEDSQKHLTDRLERYTQAVNRKEGIRYALTVLRNHDSA